MALSEENGEAPEIAPVRTGELSWPTLGTVAELPDVIDEHAIDRVVIAPGSRRSRRATRPDPRGQGAGGEGQHRAAPVRGRRLVGRVRRRRGADAARRPRLRPLALVGAAQAGVRLHCSRSAARDARSVLRSRSPWPSSSPPRPCVLPPAAHRPARPRRSRCSSSARWSTDAEELKAVAARRNEARGAVQDRRRSADHARRAPAAPHVARRAPAARQRAARAR